MDMQTLSSKDQEIPFFHSYRAVDTNCIEKIAQVVKVVTSELTDVVLTEIGMYSEKLPEDVEEWMKNKLPFEIRLKESSKYMFMREGGAVYTTSPYEWCKQMRIKMPPQSEFNTILGSLVFCYQMRNAKFLTWIFDSKNRTVVRVQSENPTRNVGIKEIFTIHAQQERTEPELDPVNIRQDEVSSQEDSFDNFCANPTKSKK